MFYLFIYIVLYLSALFIDMAWFMESRTIADCNDNGFVRLRMLSSFVSLSIIITWFQLYGCRMLILVAKNDEAYIFHAMYILGSMHFIYALVV